MASEGANVVTGEHREVGQNSGLRPGLRPGGYGGGIVAPWNSETASIAGRKGVQARRDKAEADRWRLRGIVRDGIRLAGAQVEGLPSEPGPDGRPRATVSDTMRAIAEVHAENSLDPAAGNSVSSLRWLTETAYPEPRRDHDRHAENAAVTLTLSADAARALIGVLSVFSAVREPLPDAVRVVASDAADE